MESRRGRSVRNVCVSIVVLAGLICSQATAAEKTATWVGAAGGGDGVFYDDPNNWDIDGGGNPGQEVPTNNGFDTYTVGCLCAAARFNVFDAGDPGKIYDVVQLTLAQGGALDVDPARKLNVIDAAAISGNISTAGGSFTALSAASSFGSRTTVIDVSGAGTFRHGSTGAYLTPLFFGDVLRADGAGSLLDLSGLQTIDAG